MNHSSKSKSSNSSSKPSKSSSLNKFSLIANAVAPSPIVTIIKV